MKNILSHLYYGDLHEVDRSVKNLQNTMEFKKYDEACEKLQKTLSSEQKELFEEYFQWEAAYSGIEKEETYANGVKTGMLLALELINFEPI